MSCRSMPFLASTISTSPRLGRTALVKQDVPGLPIGDTITSLVVNPLDRDDVYAVVNRPAKSKYDMHLVKHQRRANLDEHQHRPSRRAFQHHLCGHRPAHPRLRAPSLPGHRPGSLRLHGRAPSRTWQPFGSDLPMSSGAFSQSERGHQHLEQQAPTAAARFRSTWTVRA